MILFKELSRWTLTTTICSVFLLKKKKSTTNLLVVTLGIDSSNTCGAEETVLARRSERDITMPEPFQTLSSSKQPP